MTEQILRQIEINTRLKTGFDVTVTGKSTTLDTSFSPELVLDGNWGIALQNISTYNSIANINSTNNNFKYFNGTTWKTVTIGTGSYEITELNQEIIRLMKINGDYDTANDVPYIEISVQTYLGLQLK